jgi:uncharacterized membrane protein YfcA
MTDVLDPFPCRCRTDPAPDAREHDVDLTYLWLFPISVIIAAIANGAGIGGATFFSPLFLIVLGLEPSVAVGAALVTEVFGFASGVIAHARARAIDWRVVRMLAVVSVPAAIIGSLLSNVAPELLLKVVLGTGLAGIAVTFVRHHDTRKEDAEIALGIGAAVPAVSRRIVTADDTVYEYELCRVTEGRTGAGIGGLLVGLISTGLGEANWRVRLDGPARFVTPGQSAVVFNGDQVLGGGIIDVN